MGNTKSAGKVILQKPGFYTGLLDRTVPGDCIFTCSFEKWVEGVNYITGFADTADYETQHDAFSSKLFLPRPDTLDGRYLKVHKACNTRIFIEEKRLHKVYMIPIPACHTSGKIPLRSSDYRTFGGTFAQNIVRDSVMVIGCHGNLAVVQVLDRKHCYVPEFYFVNLEEEKCVAKFHTKDSELMWYECYISPDLSRVILRANVNTYAVNDLVKFHNLHALQVITMKKFADSGGHAIAFDNRHGHQYLFRAKDKDVQLFDFEAMDVIQSSRNLPLPAAIKQIKSSPSGDYVAVRCLHPAFSMEYQINVIGVLDAATLGLLLRIDASGCYWAASEAINIQVFPRFSSCDSAMAVMRHGPSKRRVSVYKLPIVMRSLQHLCRLTIRRLVFRQDLNQLQLPTKMVRYLNYEQ